MRGPCNIVRDNYKTNNNLALSEADKIKIPREDHKTNINVTPSEANNCILCHKTTQLDSKNHLWAMPMIVFSRAKVELINAMRRKILKELNEIAN